MRAAALAAALAAPALAARLSSADLVALYGHSAPPAPRTFTPTAPAQSLRDAAAARGLFIGAAINAGCLANASEPYNATFVREFSLATAENECKFAATEASAGDFTLGACGALEAAALGAGGVFRNHNLCWGSYNPAWLEKLDAAALRGALAAHIAAMGAAFGASSFAFDVVNEAVIDGDGAKTVFKNNTWFPKVPDYVEYAFTQARAAAPKAKLFYNEYGAEGLGVKSDKVYTLAKGLAAKGLLDGVGLQMHIAVESYPTFADVSANIARLVALGLDVHITEMDVRCAPAADGALCSPARLAAQAGVYAGMLGACLANVRATAPSGRGGCKSLETWGITDKHTWLYDFNNPTHANEMPLLFDLEYAPKPAYAAMLTTLQGAGDGAHAPADAISVDLTAAKNLGLGVVPPDFASFSYEVGCAIPMFSHAGGARASFVGLMKQLQAVNGARGPNMRIGGNSADESAFAPGSGALPDDAKYRITPADFAAYAAAVPLWNGSLTAGLNFRGGANATLEAAHAAALGAALGWGAASFVEALEVGNECDLYTNNGDRPAGWGGADYAREAGAVMAALERGAGVPAARFQGATFCCGHFDGILPAYIDANRASLRSISFHEYPLNVCQKPTPAVNTIYQLLSADRITTPIKNILGVINATRARGLPFFIGEGNSVACGGQRNVSDVFAAALWAVDALFSHAEAGVARWNFHGCPAGAYTAVAYADVTADEPDVRPLFYGMYAFTAAARGGELFAPKVAASSDLLRAHAVRSPAGEWRVTIVHKDPLARGAARATVRLPGAARGAGRVSRLVAPGNDAFAKAGISFEGLTWDGTRDGTPSGTRVTDAVAPGPDGAYAFDVAPGSVATLVVPA